MHSAEDIQLLIAKAGQLGIAVDEFRRPDGSIDSVQLAYRVSDAERSTSDFRFGRLLWLCVGAFLLCGFGTWLALKLAR